jgi:hypothetical protein
MKIGLLYERVDRRFMVRSESMNVIGIYKIKFKIFPDWIQRPDEGRQRTKFFFFFMA